MERRFSEGGVSVETRSDGKKVFAGHASVFHDPNDAGTEYKLRDNLTERVARSAFTRALSERQDVRGLFNHNPDNLLGRLGAGTLRLSIDQRGLKYEIDFNENDADHQRVMEKLKRGDIEGSSFSFEARKAPVVRSSDGMAIRTLEDLDLFDIGPVTFPAYKSAHAGARALPVVSEAVDKELAELDKAAEAERVAVRLRLLELEGEQAWRQVKKSWRF